MTAGTVRQDTFVYNAAISARGNGACGWPRAQCDKTPSPLPPQSTPAGKQANGRWHWASWPAWLSGHRNWFRRLRALGDSMTICASDIPRQSKQFETFVAAACNVCTQARLQAS